MADTIPEAISDAAKDGVQSVSGDTGSVSKIPIKDQIEAAKYGEQRTASAKNHLGLFFRQLEPGGTG